VRGKINTLIALTDQEIGLLLELEIKSKPIIPTDTEQITTNCTNTQYYNTIPNKHDKQPPHFFGKAVFVGRPFLKLIPFYK